MYRFKSFAVVGMLLMGSASFIAPALRSALQSPLSANMLLVVGAKSAGRCLRSPG